MSTKENVSKELLEEVVRSFSEARLRVLGTSMAPALLHGDLISVQRIRFEEVSPGEIVLFVQDGRMFVHRVVSRAGSAGAPWLITRGDRLGHNDPAVLPSHLLGRVTSVRRGHREFVPDARVRGWNWVILALLRTSDLATRVYLRAAALLRVFSTRKDNRRHAVTPSVETPWAR